MFYYFTFILLAYSFDIAAGTICGIELIMVSLHHRFTLPVVTVLFIFIFYIIIVVRIIVE
jgi:hypothetical protein